MRLDVNDVRLAYGNRQVLDGINLTLGPGEGALLLGPSGSGKSSLLNIICGLQSPDSGAVLCDGEPMAGREDDVRRTHMGIIFQTLRLVSALSLRANLLLAQKLQTGRKNTRAIDDLLEKLAIAHRASARPYELSQGEAQRAAIARALIGKPQLLIADEPTSALDKGNTQVVANLLLECARDAGASLLIATHDERLQGLFDRSFKLIDGRIAA